MGYSTTSLRRSAVTAPLSWSTYTGATDRPLSSVSGPARFSPAFVAFAHACAPPDRPSGVGARCCEHARNKSHKSPRPPSRPGRQSISASALSDASFVGACRHNSFNHSVALIPRPAGRNGAGSGPPDAPTVTTEGNTKERRKRHCGARSVYQQLMGVVDGQRSSARSPRSVHSPLSLYVAFGRKKRPRSPTTLFKIRCGHLCCIDTDDCLTRNFQFLPSFHSLFLFIRSRSSRTSVASSSPLGCLGQFVPTFECVLERCCIPSSLLRSQASIVKVSHFSIFFPYRG